MFCQINVEWSERPDIYGIQNLEGHKQFSLKSSDLQRIVKPTIYSHQRFCTVHCCSSYQPQVNCGKNRILVQLGSCLVVWILYVRRDIS